ncbi:MAG: hypothetical protein ACK5S5_05270 [Planctomycetota bacterium]
MARAEPPLRRERWRCEGVQRHGLAAGRLPDQRRHHRHQQVPAHARCRRDQDRFLRRHCDGLAWWPQLEPQFAGRSESKVQSLRGATIRPQEGEATANGLEQRLAWTAARAHEPATGRQRQRRAQAQDGRIVHGAPST